MHDAQIGEDKADRRTLISDERHSRINEDTLANRFGISGKTARETLKVTHQNGTRSALLPLSRRYKADRMYKLRLLEGKFATDTFYAKKKSLLETLALNCILQREDLMHPIIYLVIMGSRLGNH